MEHHRPLRRLRGAALVTAAALIVSVMAGCSSPSAPAGNTSATPAASAEEELISIRVARGAVNLESAIIAQEQGFFEQEGLEVDLQVTGGGGGAATNSALIAGEFDIAATDAVTAIRAINERMPILVVAGTKSAKPDYEGEVSDGLIVPPGSTITDWKDLKGKKVGVPELGGLPYLTVVTALEENGVSLDSVEIVPVPMDALVAAAQNGQVDAVFTFSIFMLSALDAGFTRVGTGVREFLPYAPQSLWVSTVEFAEKNPEALERFRAALILGTEYGNENPDAVRKVYHENTELPAPFIDNVMILEPLDVTFNPKGWDVVLRGMKQAGEVREDLTVEDIVWEGAR
ncbi:hypothetical protein GCM10017690_31250 [Microbacterium terregens]